METGVRETRLWNELPANVLNLKLINLMKKQKQTIKTDKLI